MGRFKKLSIGIFICTSMAFGQGYAQQATPRTTLEQYEKLEAKALAETIKSFLEENKNLEVSERARMLAKHLQARKPIEISDLPEENSTSLQDEGVEQLLINGSPVDTRYFPAVFRMLKRDGSTNCTATVVGPSTIFFAAHCLQHNYQQVNFSSKTVSARGICEQAPGFILGKSDEDWALCLLNKSVTLPKFESLNFNQTIPIGQRVVLSGYGCTFRGGPAGKTLRIGIADSIERPNWLRPEENTIYAYAPNVTNGAILCPGDSGGPAYVFSSDSLTSKRWVIGTNSRTTYDSRVSLISSTFSSKGKEFIDGWRKRYNQEICGVNKRSNCQ